MVLYGPLLTTKELVRVRNRVFQNEQKSKDLRDWLAKYLAITKPLQKDLEFSSQNCGAGDFLKFGAFLEGKTAPKRPKKRDFQKMA